MSAIAEAKQRLPLPRLLSYLGLGALAKKSARCPFHDDKRNSFSIYKNGSGEFRFKCHAGCGAGDEINFLELHESLSRRDAVKRFLDLAGVNGASEPLGHAFRKAKVAMQRPATTSQSASGAVTSGNRSLQAVPAFDWQKCVDAFSAEHLERLSEWRGYPGEFCSWLKQSGLVGVVEGCIAFPVSDNGRVVAAHVRAKDGAWYFTPKGTKTRPLVIGELLPGDTVHAFESQWDGLALMVVSGERSGIVITRGASNGALVAGVIPKQATVYVWPQNDRPGQNWAKDVCAHTKCTVKTAKTPSQFADLNAWTKDGGATAKDLLDAMVNAETLREPERPLIEFRSPPQLKNFTPVDADEETLQRLAALSVLDYERTREAEAEKLGCRVAILDQLVNAKRLLFEAAGDLQGRPLNLPDVEPWPEAVNGAEVLDQVADTLVQYVAMPAGAADALALWSGHAHASPAFQHSPRAHITSPDKNCGKSTLRDVIATLVPRPLATENLSVAVLFRVIEKYRPTVLADECDAWINDNEELRGLLNAGHRRGGQALRCEGENNEVRAFNVFAPAVLCGIGALPGTLHDRLIVIRLERAKQGELRQRFDSRHVEREAELCRKLARFTADNIVALEASDPKLPNGVFNRLADNWRPLAAIAAIAGDDWPERCAAAFIKLTSREDLDAQGIGTMLLADIQQILAGKWPPPAEGVLPLPLERVFSKDLVESLVEMKERPWPEVCRGGKPITERWLARKLAAFGIHSKNLRIGEEQAKGYESADFAGVFDRYLSAIPGDFIRPTVPKSDFL